jgi:hypothetical protein
MPDCARTVAETALVVTKIIVLLAMLGIMLINLEIVTLARMDASTARVKKFA